MKEIIIEVPDRFGKTLQPEKVNSEIKGEIVRCGYCIHNTSTIHNPICGLDVYRSGGTAWFCADGERKAD